jgi:hypothetical protein
MGLRQTCLGLAMGPVSNTSLVVVADVWRVVRRPFAFARRDAVTPCPLTSLQRIEATDALPILKRFFQSGRGPAPCLRFCTVRAETC